MSLREQRNRMVHRSSDMERRAASEVQTARQALAQARARLQSVHEGVAAARAQLDAFERDVRQLGQRNDVPDKEWRAAWEEANHRLRKAQDARSAAEAAAADAEARLQRAIRDQEASSVEHARALSEVEHELDLLMREISRLQAEQPIPEAPDPRLREQILDRLQHLEAERTWISEEIAVRQERLGRISVEINHLRSLLEIHTPDWGREAISSLAPEAASDRSGPPWRQEVIAMLARASEPIHYRELAERIANVGKGLGGQDPAETLLAALGRDPEFERVGRGRYWLRSRSLPAGWDAKGGPG